MEREESQGARGAIKDDRIPMDGPELRYSFKGPKDEEVAVLKKSLEYSYILDSDPIAINGIMNKEDQSNARLIEIYDEAIAKGVTWDTLIDYKDPTEDIPKGALI